MFGYKLLGKPQHDVSSGYRGTYRLEPAYNEQLDDNHPINEAAVQYMNSDFQDKDFYIELATKLSFCNIYYDVVFIDSLLRESNLGLNIGYDVSIADHYSFLAFNMESEAWSLQPLLLMTNKYFKYRTNKYNLFDNFQDAVFFKNVIISLSERGFNLEAEEVIADIGVVNISVIYSTYQ